MLVVLRYLYWYGYGMVVLQYLYWYRTISIQI